ncbi:MAG TPA: fibronectin type III domain-containing protein, partial [Polyangiaceae bacterium]
MTVAKTPGPIKPLLAVKQAPQSGTVIVKVNARQLVGKSNYRRVTFNWQFSADGGKTWTSAPSTPLASTEIAGLTPLTTYSFRVSATVSKAVGAWSQAISFLVR